jgi:hypothetical protein
MLLLLCSELLLACALVGNGVAFVSVRVSSVGMSKALSALARQRAWNSTRSACASARIASNNSLLADHCQRAVLAGPCP